MKKKILIISDHALYTSGVAVQTKYLVQGLIEKGDMMFMQLGAAVSHADYQTIKVNEDFIIKPIDGFGNKALLRSILLQNRPDAVIIFTDPRFFTWLFEMEDEIHQVCPILWWHVWDNKPYPYFNNWMYDSTDAINCHSYLTYELCKENYPTKTNYIPHSLPTNIFYRLKNDLVKNEKVRILGKERVDNFVCLWMNRNCKRKRPADVLFTWLKFLQKLDLKKRKNVTLLMHTDPYDKAGCNLVEIASSLNILDTIAFSTEPVSESLINIIHNISDVTINISYNEGFGLTTLESMQVGTPIIATKTGGLIRQVIDCNDGSYNGIALEPKIHATSGNQEVPYLVEDYIDINDAANAIYKLFNLSSEDKILLSRKVEVYAKKEFSYENTISNWHKSILETIKEFKHKKSQSNAELVRL